MLFSGIKIDKCVPKEKNKNQSERFITYKKKHVKINLIIGFILWTALLGTSTFQSFLMKKRE